MMLYDLVSISFLTFTSCYRITRQTTVSCSELPGQTLLSGSRNPLHILVSPWIVYLFFTLGRLLFSLEHTVLMSFSMSPSFSVPNWFLMYIFIIVITELLFSLYLSFSVILKNKDYVLPIFIPYTQYLNIVPDTY